jgi:hypothetical protein
LILLKQGQPPFSFSIVLHQFIAFRVLLSSPAALAFASEDILKVQKKL